VRITIRGAREHNLAEVDLVLERERLIVFCGPSGSGKSSLAFDTLHAESQRRFVEALSAHVRARLGRVARPAFQQIEGLSPSIGVAQARGAASARETCATEAEVYDLLAVAYAKAGVAHCPRCGEILRAWSVDEILADLESTTAGTALTVLAPVARARSGSVGAILAEAGAQGFVRARVDGELVRMDTLPVVDARAAHDVDVVVDRIRAGPSQRERLAEALPTAIRAGGGVARVTLDAEERTYTETARCSGCGVVVPPLEPRLFSPWSPAGACPECHGLGTLHEVDAEALVDADTSLAGGAVAEGRWPSQDALATIEARGIPTDARWSALGWEHRDWLLHGDADFEGAMRWAARRGQGVSARVCDACRASRLRPEARAVTVGEHSLPVLLRTPLDQVLEVVRAWPRSAVLDAVRAEVERRLEFLVRVGLGYVDLGRPLGTLSSGERQRLRLAAQAGNQVSGVLFVLDEPTAGLHPADTAVLLQVLRELKDSGNTVLVVEHDPAVIAIADDVVEFGPGAGAAGGRVVFHGTPAALLEADTLAGRWLSGRAAIPARAPAPARGWIEIEGAVGHNLRLDCRLPLGVLAAVTGVSGSGKSSLVFDTLAAAMAGRRALPHAAMRGHERVTRVVHVDASPLGKSARSNVATATKTWDAIRELLAKTAIARERGFTPTTFSMNVAGGRCETCEGEGVRRVRMDLLPDVHVTCETCQGRRFTEAALAATWKGFSASDLLAMPVRQARTVFSAVPALAGVLATLDALGLGYLPLGQPTDTLSGGEAQRVRLARELGKPGEVEGALYLLDEPSVGLHPSDVADLVEALRRLVTLGASVLVVEHDPVLLSACDWIVELGPGGGESGGRLVAAGTPAAIRATPGSKTGPWLRA
jgi:excinuclease ABC subunit A